MRITEIFFKASISYDQFLALLGAVCRKHWYADVDSLLLKTHAYDEDLKFILYFVLEGCNFSQAQSYSQESPNLMWTFSLHITELPVISFYILSDKVKYPFHNH